MWITLATTCHIFRDKIIFKQQNMTMMITLFSLIILQMLSKLYIYSRQNFIKHVSNTTSIRIFQKFYYNYHGDCRILANGTWICHLECCYCLTSILGRRPWPDYPRHSLRTCLHHLLLDTYQPHTTSTIWSCFIWTFCHHIKCSIYPAVIISRWGLREWF